MSCSAAIWWVYVELFLVKGLAWPRDAAALRNTAFTFDPPPFSLSKTIFDKHDLVPIQRNITTPNELVQKLRIEERLEAQSQKEDKEEKGDIILISLL